MIAKLFIREDMVKEIEPRKIDLKGKTGCDNRQYLVQRWYDTQYNQNKLFAKRISVETNWAFHTRAELGRKVDKSEQIIEGEP